MKIKAIEPIAVSLPMKKPVQMAGETVTRADNVLVRIESDDGVVGWGEAASAPTMTGETVASMMAAVELLTPGLLKRSAGDFAGASAAMDARLYGNSGAKAAIEIALHDLVGRATHRPVYALLGARQRRRMPVLAVIGSDRYRGGFARGERAMGRRLSRVQDQGGIGAASADAERTRAVCLALKGMGEPCLVSADANQGFGVDDALAYVRALGDCGSGFLRTADRGARSRRHGARRRGKPRADRRRRGPAFRRRHRPPS